MEDLLLQYKETLRMVHRAYASASEDDKKILSACATGISYIIRYIEHGGDPGNRRGVTRLAGYQREVPFDPSNVYFVRECALQRKLKNELSEEQKTLLDDLLGILTVRENEAFVMVRGNCLSYGQAAKAMKVSKGTVQNLVDRAEKKLHFVVRKPSNSRGNLCSGKLSKPVQRVMFAP